MQENLLHKITAINTNASNKHHVDE